MSNSVRKITRAQLAEFLPDQRAIRAFEQLLEQISTLLPEDIATINQLIQDSYVEAVNANTSANQANDSLARIAQALEVMASNQAPVAHNSVSTDYIDIDVSPPTPASKVGRLWWSQNGTLNLGMGGGNITQQIGEEVFRYGKASSAISDTNLQLVYRTGSVGSSGVITFAPTVAGLTDDDLLVGVATEPIANNAFGRVTEIGIVNGINTTGSAYGETWADNDDIWYNPVTGGLTKTRPTAPGLKAKIGSVIKAGSGGSGVFNVKINGAKAIGDLNDVYAPTPALNSVLEWSTANNRWQATATPAFGDATGTSNFEADGTLRFDGAATVWRDIDFPIIIRSTGANIPTLTTLQGNITVPQWAVNDFNVCEGQELVHEWKEGSTVYWHVHIITNGLEAVDKYIAFEVEWFWVNMGGVISATTTTVAPDLLIPANTPSKTMMIYTLSNATLTGGKIGGHVYARLRRVASVGAAPAANPWCSMLQMHVECDTTGSRNIGTK